MKASKYIVAAAAILLASCEKEVIVKIPEHTPKIVINGVNISESDSMEVSVSKSIDVLKRKKDADLAMKDAIVMLKPEGKAPLVMTFNKERGTYVAPKDMAVGKYEIEVTATGFEKAHATSVIPSLVPIKNVQRIKNARLDIDGNAQDEIRITFSDPATINDYYVVSVEGTTMMVDTFIVEGIKCINTNDASVESVYNETIDVNTCIDKNGIFLRDKLFNGSEKTLSLFMRSENLNPQFISGQGDVYPIVTLLHVTEDYFKYLKTYMYAFENEGNPFAEPTNVHSNVKNGYGIFSMVSASAVEIK